MVKRSPLENGDDLTLASSASATSSPGVHAVNTNVGSASPSSAAGGTPTDDGQGSLNAPPSVSAVWAYFEKDAMGNSVCKFCERMIKGHHSSNLLSHLRTAGRTDATHQQASSICEEHRETKRTVKRQKLAMPTAAEFAATYPHLVAAAAAAAMPSFNSPFTAALKKDSGYNYPSTTTAMAAAAAAASLSRDQLRDSQTLAMTPGANVTCSADQLAQDFALMVLTENLPMNFATQPGFQNFAQLVLADKKSLLPDEETVTKNILMLQQSLSLTSKMLLARTKGVAISLESWTHPSPDLSATAKYLAITTHFSLNFRPYRITLSCVPVGSGVDVATLKSLVDQTLERAGIKDKVVACIVGDLPWKQGVEMATLTSSDLPCGFVPPASDGRDVSSEPQQPTQVIPCASSLLRRCINKSMVAACFSHHVLAVDAFFNQFVDHSDAYSALKRKCPLLDPAVLAASAAEDASYYDFLRDLHESLPTLEKIAQEWQFETLVAPVVEWIALVTKKLRPFARYADAFEGEKQKRNGSDKEVFKNSSSSVSTIAAFLVEYVEKQADGAFADGGSEMLSWKSFYMAIAKDLRTRFTGLSAPSLAATLLDPRYKNRDCCFLKPEIEQLEAEEYLRRVLEIPSGDAIDSGQSAGSGGAADDAKHASEDEDDDLLAQLPSTTSKESGHEGNELTTTWTNELTAFLSLPLAERNVDPMAWWKSNQLRFPLLAPCAELLLSLPAAATTGESTQRRVNQTLLRVEGYALDPSIATTPPLVDAFLSFQKNRENAIEWFRSNSTALSDASSVASDAEAAATHFRHVELV